MYSMHNEGKSVVVPERLIRILKNKIYTHMKAVSKNLYFDVSDIVDKYNNTVHRTIGMKPIDVKSNYMPNAMLILTKKILNLK